MVTPMVTEIIPASQPRRRRTAGPVVSTPNTFEGPEAEYSAMTVPQPQPIDAMGDDQQAVSDWIERIESNWA